VDLDDLIVKHGAALLLYAKQWTRSGLEAEDLVQDGLLRFWQNPGLEVTPESELPARLFGILRWTALDRLRSDRRRLVRETKAAECMDDETPMFRSALEQDEERQRIEDAMKALPKEQSEVVVMKIWGGLTFREIAKALGVSQNTAASRYRLALTALRNEFDEEDAHGH
jgi:RNA polymerase sigma-70 factor (ECF subfamily)